MNGDSGKYVLDVEFNLTAAEGISTVPIAIMLLTTKCLTDKSHGRQSSAVSHFWRLPNGLRPGQEQTSLSLKHLNFLKPDKEFNKETLCSRAIIVNWNEDPMERSVVLNSATLEW